MMLPTEKSIVRTAWATFFKVVNEDNDLYDHPDLFSVIDDWLREEGFKLAAEQMGVRGTHIHIIRDEKEHICHG
jgi:hypothetical protein